MIQYLKKWFEGLLLKERSIEKLSASFCLGAFIAIAPIIPLQTPLLLVFCWLFGLNAAVSVAALYLINNPFTLVPIYIMDYAVGVWFFKKVVGIDLVQYNPWWIDRFNAFLSRYIDVEKYLGAELCFWCLLAGGFMMALMVSLPLYPLLKRALTRLAAQLEKSKLDKSKNVEL